MSISFSIPPKVANRLRPIWRYRLVIFIVFVAGLSGYLVLQINTALNVTPGSDGSAVGRKSLTIDPALVTKLKQLQDNSVSVQSFFNTGRDNPFE